MDKLKIGDRVVTHYDGHVEGIVVAIADPVSECWGMVKIKTGWRSRWFDAQYISVVRP